MKIEPYEMTDKDYINPPWINNYEEWKYRRVIFHGRPKHRFSMELNSTEHGHSGFH